MKTISATQARQNFGEFLETAIREPVVIQRHSRDLGVFLPMTLYSRLIEGINANALGALDRLQGKMNPANRADIERAILEENPS